MALLQKSDKFGWVKRTPGLGSSTSCAGNIHSVLESWFCADLAMAFLAPVAAGYRGLQIQLWVLARPVSFASRFLRICTTFFVARLSIIIILEVLRVDSLCAAPHRFRPLQAIVSHVQVQFLRSFSVSLLPKDLGRGCICFCLFYRYKPCIRFVLIVVLIGFMRRV